MVGLLEPNNSIMPPGTPTFAMETLASWEWIRLLAVPWITTVLVGVWCPQCNSRHSGGSWQQLGQFREFV